MKRPQFLYPYLTKVPLSTPIVPWVTIRFLSGLSGPPVIYPCGNSHNRKYIGLTVVEVAVNDPSYLQWCLSKDIIKNERLKDAIEYEVLTA